MKAVKQRALSFVLAVALIFGIAGVFPGQNVKAEEEKTYTLADVKNLLGIGAEYEALNGDIIQIASEEEIFVKVKKNGAGEYTAHPMTEFEGTNVSVRIYDSGAESVSLINNDFNMYFSISNGVVIWFNLNDKETLDVISGDYFKKDGQSVDYTYIRDLMLSGKYTDVEGNTIEKGTGNDFIRVTKKGGTGTTINSDSYYIKVRDYTPGSGALVYVAPKPQENKIPNSWVFSITISGNSISRINITPFRGGDNHGLADIGINWGTGYNKPGTPTIELSQLKAALGDDVFTSLNGHEIKRAEGADDFITIKNGSGEKSVPMSRFKLEDYNGIYGNIKYTDEKGKAQIIPFWIDDNDKNKISNLAIRVDEKTDLGLELSEYYPALSVSKDELFNKIPSDVTFNGYAGDTIKKGSGGDNFLVVTTVEGNTINILKSKLQLYYEHVYGEHVINAWYYHDSSTRLLIMFHINFLGQVYQFQFTGMKLPEGPFREDIVPDEKYAPARVTGPNEDAIYFVSRQGKKFIVRSYRNYIGVINEIDGCEPYIVDGKHYCIYEQGNTPCYRVYNPNGSEEYYTFDYTKYSLLKNLGWEDGGAVFYSNSTFQEILDKINPTVDWTKPLTQPGNQGGSASTSTNTNSNLSNTTSASAPVYVPSAPSRQVEIPVSGDTSTAADIKISGNTAVIGDISSDAITKAVSDLADTHVSLDLSSQRGVTAATLSTSTLQNIASSNESEGLEIRFAGGNIKLDNAALADLTSKAGGEEITISIKTVATSVLNEAQSDALKDVKVQIVVQPEISVGNKPVSYENSANSSGIMTLFLPYNLQPGQKGEFLHVYYVDDSGNLSRHKTEVGNGGVSFTTNHNSYYVVIYDESYSNEDFLNIYRAYNPKTGDHLFTNSSKEYSVVTKNGWNPEGIAFDVNKEGGNAVFRLYNSATGEHIYTAQEKEKDKCVAQGWQLEGKIFSTGGDTEVYRLYNPALAVGNHLFTTNKQEYDILPTKGWIQEGVAFMAY